MKKKKNLELPPDKIEGEPLARKLKRLKKWAGRVKCQDYNFRKRDERSLKRFVKKYLATGVDKQFENFSISELVRHLDGIKPGEWDDFDIKWTIICDGTVRDIGQVGVKMKKESLKGIR